MKKSPFILSACLLAVFFSFSQKINWQWARGAIGPGSDEGWACATDKSGNVYITGSFNGDSITFSGVSLYYNASSAAAGFGINLFVAKYSPSGNLLWAKTPYVLGDGGLVGYGIATDEQNNVFVTGSYNGDSIFFDTGFLPPTGQNMEAIFTVKYDSLGNELWANGVGGILQDFGSGIATDNNGNAYITGFFSSDSLVFGTSVLHSVGPAGSSNSFVAKYNTNGQALWAECPGVSGSPAVQGVGMAADENGNVYATGFFQGSDVKFGNTTLQVANSGSVQIYLVKFDAAGNVLWAKETGAGDELVRGISSDSAGNVAITGTFGGDNITFGSIQLNNNSAVTGDYFIAKYDPNGNVLWAHNSNACLQCSGFGVASDNCGNIYVAGGYMTTPQYLTITIEDTTIFTGVPLDDPIFVITYNAAGQALCISGLASGGDDVYGIALDRSGNAYIGSDFESGQLIANHDTLNRTGNESIYVAKFNCPACSVGGGCESLEYQLSSSGLCRGDSVVIDFTNITNASISPNNYVAWINSTQAALYPDTTTLFTIKGDLPCGSATLQTLTLTVLGDSVKVTCDKEIICPGDSAQLCATIGFTNYNWNTNENTACIYAHDAGDYYVTATAGANCSATSTPVFLNEYPAPSVSILVEGDTLASYGATGYQWFLNGTAINGATNSVYIAHAGGSYELQVTDTNGCTALSSAVTITGISEVNSDNVSIYPNPSTGAWELIVDNNLIGNEAELFDAEGRLVYKTQILNLHSEISFDAASGIYTLRITGGGFIVVKKLVKL